MPLARCGPLPLPRRLAQAHSAAHLPRLDALLLSARTLDRLPLLTTTALHGVTESKKSFGVSGGIEIYLDFGPTKSGVWDTGWCCETLSHLFYFGTFFFFASWIPRIFFSLLICSCHAPTLSHAAFFFFFLYVIDITALLYAVSGAPQRSHERGNSITSKSIST